MKRIVIGILWMLAGGCISNDVPDPVIYGNVTKIEFNGQQKCAINTKTRIIDLTLSDTVDIQRVRLNVLELEAMPARKQEVLILPEASIAVDTFLNLSQVCRFTVNTYQSYEWTIKAEQPIERWVKVENQAGDEVINVGEKMVSVYLKKGQDLSDVRITDLQLGPSIATYQPNWSDLKDFKRKQTILVNCFGRTERWEIAMFEEREEEEDPAGEGMAVTVNEWAHFAYVSAKLPAGTEETPAFEYKSGGGAWQRVEAEVSGNVFQTKLEGLKANTRYTVRVVVGEQAGTESTFTTERDDQVPYSNFDTWYLSGKAWCTGEDGIVTWDSGNKGSANYGNTNPTTEEKMDVVKGSAARLASCYAVIKFAAGSLYTGKFGGIDAATLNAKLDFGIPYTCRPTTLTGYYKYDPATVNRIPTGGKYEFLKNTTDSCHIYVALCEWTDVFHANSTPPGTFVDYSENNPSIIAYGELKDNKKMDKYEKFTIDIKYRDLTRKPTYIVIVATSSKYGDYFAGAEGSVLLLDEFELGFD